MICTRERADISTDLFNIRFVLRFECTDIVHDAAAIPQAESALVLGDVPLEQPKLIGWQSIVRDIRQIPESCKRPLGCVNNECSVVVGCMSRLAVLHLVSYIHR